MDNAKQVVGMLWFSGVFKILVELTDCLKLPAKFANIKRRFCLVNSDYFIHKYNSGSQFKQTNVWPLTNNK